MKKLLSLMRIHQWYKNLLVFLPILFSQQILDLFALQKTAIGFISLCLVSSSCYVFNDIIDRKKDINHPNAKKKYIARGIIRVDLAFAFASLLLVASVAVASLLSVEFLYFVVLLFALTKVYSLWLKNEIFVDVILISVNFVLRAVSGAFVIVKSGAPYIWVSPWLIVCTFLLALFVAVGKRNAELLILKKKAAKFKPVLKYYSPNITSSLLSISTAALLISYLLYTFQSINQILVVTAPFAAYTIFRYLYLAYSGSNIPLSPGKFYKDSRLTIGALLWAASIFIVLYLI